MSNTFYRENTPLTPYIFEFHGEYVRETLFIVMIWLSSSWLGVRYRDKASAIATFTSAGIFSIE
jgi:hypothetical protein